jgi:hypothetical protein
LDIAVDCVARSASGEALDEAVVFGDVAVATGAHVGGSGDNIVVVFGDVAVVATGADVGWCRCRLDWC